MIICYNDVEKSQKGRENSMKRCQVTITTAVDDQETEFSCEGTLALSARSATICYKEENASVSLVFDGETARVERNGDYCLQLFLKCGEENEGILGFGENAGQIKVYTHRVAYSIGRDSVLASLHYDLLFGTESQKMKLRVLARYIR